MKLSIQMLYFLDYYNYWLTLIQHFYSPILSRICEVSMHLYEIFYIIPYIIYMCFSLTPLPGRETESQKGLINA